MTFAVEYRAGGPRSKWRPLSQCRGSRRAEWHCFGWMLVIDNSGWHVGETEGERAEELVAILRQRQAKLDAPGVLDACEEAGVWVGVEGENLRATGPLTDELRGDLKRCKPELIRLLAEVPVWNDAEAADLQRRLKEGHSAVRTLLHPAEDDVFSIAGRNVLADVLASVARAIAVRRLDTLRRRVDFALGWMATLDKRLHDLRPDYSLNSQPLHLTHFNGKPTQAMLKRQERDQRSARLEKERRFAEAAAVQAEGGEESD